MEFRANYLYLLYMFYIYTYTYIHIHIHIYIQEEMQMWFASTRAPTCATKTSGCAQIFCTKVWRGAQRQCAKIPLGPSHKTFCAKVHSVPQRLCTKFESSPRIFVCCTKSWCAQRLCTHKVFVHTKPSCAPRSLHTDNPNGSGIVVLNNRNTINII